MSTYYFLPWVRSGMARLITAPDLGTDTLPDVTSGGIVLPITVTMNGKQVTPVNAGPPQLYGPGDVVGIDVRGIIRTGPLHLTPDYPPERFAFIEFDRPDFPWLFTPGASSTQEKKKDRLRPWLVLVVVEKSQATISATTENKLPVLSCPMKELPPNLTESWAWAHAVYAGDAGLDQKTVESKLYKDPADRNLSRLLCPRKLTAHTSYDAFLVPAFEAGRKAGLGQDVDPETERLVHWSFTTDDEVKLPVYYHWSFSTGDEDQFIKLAQQLQPLSAEERKLALSGVAGDMDLRNPGNGMGEFNNLATPTLPIPSALRIMPDPPPPGTALPPRPKTPELIKNQLENLLLKPHDTALPPPVYGSWHASSSDVSAQLKAYLWLETLNLDPRYRVAAALGSSIIQKDQEHIIAAVWKEVGDLQAGNELLQRKQLACRVTDSIYKKRLVGLSPVAFLQVTEPVPLPRNEGVDSAVNDFRKLPLTQAERNRGGTRSALPKSDTATSANLTADDPLTRFAAAVQANSMTPLEQVSIVPQFRRLTRAGRSWSVKGSISMYTPALIAPRPGDRKRIRPASITRPPLTVSQTALTDISHLLSLKQKRLAQIAPRTTFVEEVAQRVQRPSRPSRIEGGEHEERFHQHGELGPFTYAPRFSNPMYEPLRDQFPEMLLPGLDKIPNDRATLLTVDASFIEAYMIGLNHELSREFLWREFPTMLNVTYFQQFWDARGAENSQVPDIPKSIGDWERRSDLGGHLASGRGGDLTFLLIRSELIIRYPNALIYARKTAVNNQVDPLLPILRFSPITGVALLGFSIANVRDWTFFVEEHFTEPYMGPKQGGSDESGGRVTPYVSFVNSMSTGTPLYESENSAHLAADILRDRYFREIKVIMDPGQTPTSPHQ